MHRLTAALALASVVLSSEALAQATTYTFTGAPYDSVTPPPACTVGECTTYVLGQTATISLTFAAPLAPNLPAVDRRTGVIAYTLNDGVRTTVGPGPNAALFGATFGTDAAGVPVSYQIVGERTPGPPYTINTPADPNSRLTYVRVASTQSSATANAICSNRAPSAFAGPGFCTIGFTDAGSSEALSTAASTVTVTAAPAAVPTLSEWAMILLGLILAGGAALHLQRRRLAV